MNEGFVSEIIREIWDHDKKHKEVNDSYTISPMQVALLALTGMSLVALVAIVLISAFNDGFNDRKANEYILISISSCLLFGMTFQISMLRPVIDILKHPTKSLLYSLHKTAGEDYNLSEKFSSYGYNELLYIRERVAFELTNTRRKVSVVAGPIHSLGIVPALISFLVAWQDSKSEIDSLFWSYGAAGLVLLYFIAVPSLLLVNRLERYLMLIDAAIRIQNNETDKLKPTGK